MTKTTPFAGTRGGILVGTVVVGIIAFEIRTVLGMLFGMDVPLEPYAIAVLVVLGVFTFLADVLGRLPERAKRSE
ncbi:hypothetical protein [Halapricum salinum]|uniref:CbaC protein n=1 Tax=Halapricum salinum TaxID=1457250 RepID=A0A4D6HEF3_9EURY|nr:hypothetical protein [Halapricum salinum]QCC51666.1 CbaC protein [Halapricum salinum]